MASSAIRTAAALSRCRRLLLAAAVVVLSLPFAIASSIAASVTIPAVRPASNSGAQSFIRIINPGTAAGTYSVTFSNDQGQSIGAAGGSVAANTAQQIQVGVSATGLLSANVSLSFDGDVQHVTFNAVSSALENATVCPAYGDSAPTAVFNVHTSRLAANPSRIVIVNTGAATAPATLILTDNAAAATVATWTSAPIPAGSFTVVNETDIEAASGWHPGANDSYVTVSLDLSSFTGTLRHMVANPAPGGTADMTLRCRVPQTIVDTVNPAETLFVPAVYPQAPAGPVSYFRLINTSGTSGWYQVTLMAQDGSIVSTANGTVAAQSASQVVAAPNSGSALLAANVRLGFDGSFQHVLWDGATLINLPLGTTDGAATVLYNVDSSLVAIAPSTVVISNTGTAAASATLTLTANASGNQIGQWTSLPIAPGASTSITEAALEQAIRWTPSANDAYVTISLNPGFSGTLQHLVSSAAAGSTTDLTTIARLRRTGVGTSLSGTISGWNSTQPAQAVVTSVGDNSTLVTAPVSSAGTFTATGLDPHEQYNVAIDQTGAQFVRTNAAAAIVAGDALTFQSQPVAGLSANQFVYHWSGNPTASGAEYASYVNAPLTVSVSTSATASTTSSSSSSATDASAALLTTYGIQLDDSEVPWTREYAARLLDMLNRIPNLQTTGYQALSQAVNGQVSTWTLTNDALDNDVQHLDATYRNGRVRVSSAAFTYAEPLLATVNGQQGTFFSNRLFLVAVRYATEDATALPAVQALMKARYGVQVAIDSTFGGVYGTLPVAAADRNPSLWQVFKPDEFLAIIAIFEEFPDGMHDLSFPSQPTGLRYLLRRVDGYQNPNGAAAIAWTSSGYIEFTADALEEDAFDTYRLIAHEKAHFVWRSLASGTLREQWLSLSGWYQPAPSEAATCTAWAADRDTWTSNITTAELDSINEDPFDPGEAITSSTNGSWASCSTTQFVSAYAADINPNEDFAESVAYFLTDPDFVRSRALPKYDFLRDNIMQGTEYLTVIRPDLTFQVLDLYPDYTYPGKISSVDIAVAGGPADDKVATVTVGVATADCDTASDANCLASVSSAYLRVFSTIGTYVDVYLSPAGANGNTVTGSFTIPKSAAAGWWTPRAITLSDPLGNQRTETMADQDFGWELYANNAFQDTTPPAYVPHSITAVLLSAGDPNASAGLLPLEHEIVADWRVIENVSMQSGYCFTRLAYAPTAGSNTPNYIDTYGANGANGAPPYSGYTPFTTAQNDGATGICEVRVRATPFFPSGSWYVGEIAMEDAALNITQLPFAANSTVYEAPPQVNVVSADSDTVPPVADIGVCQTSDPMERCLRVSAVPTDPANPNGETVVTISYWAYEQQPVADASGLDSASLVLLDPQGAQHQFYHMDTINTVPGRAPQRTLYFVCPSVGVLPGATSCDATTPVQYVFQTVLPVGSAPGTWGLMSLALTDKARNVRTYGFTETLEFVVNSN